MKNETRRTKEPQTRDLTNSSRPRYAGSMPTGPSNPDTKPVSEPNVSAAQSRPPKAGFMRNFFHRPYEKTIPAPGPREQGLSEHAQTLRQGVKLVEAHQQNSGSSPLDERTKNLFNAPVVGGAIAGGTKMIMNAEAGISEGLANIPKIARHIDVGEAAREVAKGERIATREGHEANLDHAVRGIGSLFHRWTPDAVERPRLTKEGRMQRLEERINRDVAAAHAMGIEPKYSPEVGELSPDEQRQIDLVTAGLARNVATDLAGEGVGSRIMEHAGWTRGEWGIKLSEQIRPSIRVSRVDGVLRIQTETHQGSADQIRSDPATGDISVFRDANGNPTNPPVGTVARMDITTFEYKNGQLVVVQKAEDGSIHETKLRPPEEQPSRTVGVFRKREVRDEMMMLRRVEQRTVANIQAAMRNESTHVTAVRLGGADFGSPRTGIFVEHGSNIHVPTTDADVRPFAARITRDRLHMGQLPGDFIMDATGGEFRSASAKVALEEAGISIAGFNESAQDRAEGGNGRLARVKKYSPATMRVWNELTSAQKGSLLASLDSAAGGNVTYEVREGRAETGDEQAREQFDQMVRERVALEKKLKALGPGEQLSDRDQAAFEDLLNDEAVMAFQLDTNQEGGILGADKALGTIVDQVDALRSSNEDADAVASARQLLQEKYSIPDDDPRMEIVDRLAERFGRDKEGNQVADMMEASARLSRRQGETFDVFEARVRETLGKYLDAGNEQESQELERRTRDIMNHVELTPKERGAVRGEAAEWLDHFEGDAFAAGEYIAQLPENERAIYREAYVNRPADMRKRAAAIREEVAPLLEVADALRGSR